MKSTISYVILLLVSVTICYAGDPKADCADELSITNVGELITSFLLKGEFPDENDKKPKCWFHCINKKENAVDDAGNINLSTMKTMIGAKYENKMSADEVSSLVDKCGAARTESDPCEKVYEFHKCHMKEFLAKSQT